MSEVSKLVYFVGLGISILITLFYVLNFFSLVFDPYKKASEAIIFLVSVVVMIAGMVISYKFGFVVQKYWQASGLLAGTCVLGLICIFVGLLFFNGPLRWQ